MAARSRWRNLAVNLCLLAGSLAITYVVVGAVFLRFGPKFLPNLTSVFPVAANIWWQASAPDPAGQDYVAIAGDSYAAGFGDWQAARRRSDEPFHAGDILARRLGRPVLGIGQSGAGSAEGLVLFPTRALNADRCLIFGKPRMPAEMVLLFYEGNDLNDNLSFIRKVLQTRPDDPALAVRTDGTLDNDYGVAGLVTCLRYFGSSLRTMWRAFTSAEEGPRGGSNPNHVVVDGKELLAPANLQGPALELREQELLAALSITARSLRWVRQKMPQMKLTVVLVPSVLTTYELGGETVSIQTYQGGERLHPVRRVVEASDHICLLLRDVARRSEAGFVDARPALRTVARKAMVHGPRDWAHFNQAGYTALGDTIADAMTGRISAGDCGQLAN